MTAIFIAAVLCAEPASTSPIVKLTHTEVVPEFPVNLLNQQVRTTFSTGVVISRSGKHGEKILILTCAHGKQKYDEHSVTFGHTGSIAGGYVMAIDQERDLAVVYIETGSPHAKPVKIVASYEDVPDKGTIVTVKGYGHKNGKGDQQEYTERQTTVVGLQRLEGDADFLRLRIKAEIKPGDSGGALIQDGKLVGICKARTTGKDVDGFFITHKQIHEFLNENGFLKK